MKYEAMQMSKSIPQGAIGDAFNFLLRPIFVKSTNVGYDKNTHLMVKMSISLGSLPSKTKQ